ncbi:flagellar protein FlgN [Candidatus Woesearchaeota archaeon]|nr:flagellar protein FlgN [Candidatus Woesearchaeota archaeon]
MNSEQSEMTALLVQIHEYLTGLSGLLEEESSALRSRDVDNLHAVAARKQDLADNLNELTVRQKSLLHATGFSVDAAGMESLLRQTADEAGLQVWQETLRMTTECKYRNEVNGAYLALLERYVESALDVMTGSPSLGETYGPKGSKSRGVASPRRSFTV